MTERGAEPVHLEGVYAISDDVVVRDDEDRLVVMPLPGSGDAGDEVYTLDVAGRAVWQKLDGVRTLRAVAAELAREYSMDPVDTEHDVLGLVAELVELGIVQPRP